MRLSKAKIVAVMSVVLVAGAGGTAFAAYVWNRHTKVPARSASVTEPSIRVSGELTGLLPGDRKPLSITVGNTNSFAVRVTDLSGGSGATKSGCSAYAVRVLPIDKSDPNLIVPARSSRTVKVDVEMQAWADAKCAGQAFEIDLNSTVSPA